MFDEFTTEQIIYSVLFIITFVVVLISLIIDRIYPRSYSYIINNQEVDLTITYTYINGKSVGFYIGHAPSTGFVPKDLNDLWNALNKSWFFTKHSVLGIDDNITRVKTSVEPKDKAQYIADKTGDICITSALDIIKYRIPNILSNPQSPIKALHDTYYGCSLPVDSDGMTMIISKTLNHELSIAKMYDCVLDDKSAPFYYSFNGTTEYYCIGGSRVETVKAFSEDGRICADHSIMTAVFYTNPERTTHKEYAFASGAELRGTGIKCEKRYVEDVIEHNPSFEQNAYDFTDSVFEYVNILFDQTCAILEKEHDPYVFTKEGQKRIKLLNLANPKKDADFTKEEVDFLCSSPQFKEYTTVFLDYMLSLQEDTIKSLYHFDEELKMAKLTQLHKDYIKKMNKYIFGETHRWDKLFTFHLIDVQKNGGFDIEESSPYYTEDKFIDRIAQMTPERGALFMCEAQYGDIWKDNLSLYHIKTDCISEGDENSSLFTRDNSLEYTKLKGLGRYIMN